MWNEHLSIICLMCADVTRIRKRTCLKKISAVGTTYKFWMPLFVDFLFLNRKTEEGFTNSEFCGWSQNFRPSQTLTERSKINFHLKFIGTENPHSRSFKQEKVINCPSSVEQHV